MCSKRGYTNNPTSPARLQDRSASAVIEKLLVGSHLRLLVVICDCAWGNIFASRCIVDLSWLLFSP